MNARLDLLQPYPFTKLRVLLANATAPAHKSHINLSIGEPKHATPKLIEEAIKNNLSGLSSYPPTKGDAALRQAIANWIARRYDIPAPDTETQVLPCTGSREALFSFVQAMINGGPNSLVICPNPFYQIYEGATLLAGSTPFYLNADPSKNFGSNWSSITADVWEKTELVFVCSPGNPAGNVMPLEEWKTLFELSDRHGFVIASDECYSEIYFSEENKPIGGMQAAQLLGRPSYQNLVCFSSLSKRSNVPGMRSGFVAGDARLLEKFLLYRTYHGCAMSPVFSAASIAAWNDEHHVEQNRALYKTKFEAVLPILAEVLDVKMPDASFYLWACTPMADEEFALRLYEQEHVTVLPGSYLARDAHGINPGRNRIRIALVTPLEQCIEGAQRIASFINNNR
ncbi:succinyldiaminopimelate transaminase [Advenella sp. WQ 585]|uniref:Succinyldiaminopimelate transaminase n=1 Tax=Advenella mandrilli TaxID=2800330 RepID=A0ABS1EEG7_9BURK|nr:succinyldiaminopimelate transaminase [Advenella mandrilli]MBK1780611.1 succinyldiaminopimelate transaminase [Advenella mandrilli]